MVAITLTAAICGLAAGAILGYALQGHMRFALCSVLGCVVGSICGVRASVRYADRRYRVRRGHCAECDCNLTGSFSTLAQRAGIDRVTVKDLGGWSELSVVEKHYTGEVPEVFRRAIEQMEAVRGVAG
jgi:hypothetical protein